MDIQLSDTYGYVQSQNSTAVSEASSVEGDEPAAPVNDGDDQQELVVQAVQDLTAGYEQHYLSMTTTVEQHILTLGRQLADCAEEVRTANAETRARIEEMFSILMKEIGKLKEKQNDTETEQTVKEIGKLKDKQNETETEQTTTA